MIRRCDDHLNQPGQNLRKASGSAHRLPSQTVTIFVHSAVTANGVAYVAASDQRLYAIRPSDGSVLWSSSQLGQPFEFTAADTPVIVNGMVYVGGGDGSLYAFGL